MKSNLATVEVYRVDRDEWSPCPNLNIKRQSHSACVLGNKLYVSGGLGEDSIEVAKCTDLISNSATW